MNKPLAVISAPHKTYSGYGSRSRDIIKSIIDLKKDEWDIQIISQVWGDTRMSFIEDNPEWDFLNQYELKTQLTKQPDYFLQITVPNEFQPIGKYNIGITAGIESTAVPHNWIEGANKMDTVWVSSKHSKKVFEDTQYEQKDQHGRTVKILKLEKPINVVMEGSPLTTYKKIEWVD